MLSDSSQAVPSVTATNADQASVQRFGFRMAAGLTYMLLFLLACRGIASARNEDSAIETSGIVVCCPLAAVRPGDAPNRDFAIGLVSSRHFR
jgi:hypothetical protein